ncbi:hypothetical protein ACL02S_22800 [Nocardia sp. 004]|uniref:hypothetical protein n=1 Tax=Nocardia sp. 004 TaxID=3385978 RepID=UPI0039A22E5E
MALRGRPPLTLDEKTWTTQRNHLPVQARADLEQLHRMATGLPGPTDIEANQPSSGFRRHIYVRPEDLDQQTRNSSASNTTPIPATTEEARTPKSVFTSRNNTSHPSRRRRSPTA